jgi:hypothetical protein
LTSNLPTYEEHCAWFNGGNHEIGDQFRTTTHGLDAAAIQSSNTSFESLDNEHIAAMNEYDRIHVLPHLDIAILEASFTTHKQVPGEDGLLSDFEVMLREYDEDTHNNNKLVFSPVR